MEIIRPLTNIVSNRVKNWAEIKKEAWELKAFLDAKKFDGYWKDAYAISHAQVSAEPKSFFVVNKKVYKQFGSWCVVNCRIIKKSEPCTFQEGCMSFMFRDEKRVNRFAKITVVYWTPFLNLFLIPRRKTFQNKVGEDARSICAFIVQHEIMHSEGRNIYGL